MSEFQNAEGYDFDPGWVLLDGGGRRRSQGVSCSVGFGAVVRHEKSTCQLGPGRPYVQAGVLFWLKTNMLRTVIISIRNVTQTDYFFWRKGSDTL